MEKETDRNSDIQEESCVFHNNSTTMIYTRKMVPIARRVRSFIEEKNCMYVNRLKFSNTK